MTKYKDIVTAPEAIKGFYPTPPDLGEKLLEGVNWDTTEDVLEPSAGKGDLIMAAAMAKEKASHRDTLRVDAVEIDPALRAALAARFDDNATDKVRGECHKYEDISRRHYNWQICVERNRQWDLEHDFPDGEPPKLTDEQQAKYGELRTLQYALKGVEVRVVGDDFLAFRTSKHYQLIVMNPPFSNGDEHLEKAIAMQERFGGEIRCILNAETLRNPHTLRRQMLVKKLKELDAEIEYVENAFANAEREARVDVALIHVVVPAPELHSDIFERLTKAEEAKVHFSDPVTTDLALNDMFERMVSQYNVECEAGIELMRIYSAMSPYILDSMKESPYQNASIQLKVGGREGCDVNEFIRITRGKYWEALFSNDEFMGKLTYDLQQKWRGKISDMADYDFSVFNIKKIALEMNGALLEGIENSIMALFHKFTDEHAWYADAKTIHYFTGWKTNKAHMIGKKVIIPAHGAYTRDDIWKVDRFDAYYATSALRDAEKVLDYFDGEGVFTTVDMSAVFNGIAKSGCVGLQSYDVQPPKNIKLKHFTVTFYKKGTVHITFHDQTLVDRFNIYCARHSGELPPDYGRKAYTDLDPNEKAVVDSFNGDGTDGSGKKAYTTVYQNNALYLSEPKQQGGMISLPSAKEV